MKQDKDQSPNLEILEALADELMKNRPRVGLVRNYMHQSGLAYKEDNLENIKVVLQALHLDRFHPDRTGCDRESEI